LKQLLPAMSAMKSIAREETAPKALNPVHIALAAYSVRDSNTRMYSMFQSQPNTTLQNIANKSKKIIEDAEWLTKNLKSKRRRSTLEKRSATLIWHQATKKLFQMNLKR